MDSIQMRDEVTTGSSFLSDRAVPQLQPVKMIGF